MKTNKMKYAHQWQKKILYSIPVHYLFGMQMNSCGLFPLLRIVAPLPKKSSKKRNTELFAWYLY